MRINRPFLGSLALAAALAAPAGFSIVTNLQAQKVAVQVKIYDRDHKDYHVWDDREDKAYRGYFVEQHKEYRPYKKLKRPEQSQYWKWRHEHPDEHR